MSKVSQFTPSGGLPRPQRNATRLNNSSKKPQTPLRIANHNATSVVVW
ncbi:MAG: hypothetical protein ACTS4X_01295 [Candidatus Hodgkinia cicadicola]